MSIFDRILLTFLTLCSMSISVMALLYSGSIIKLDFFGTSLPMYYGRWEVGVAAAVVLVVSARFLVMALKIDKINEAVVYNGELGKVGISFGAVESLVQKVIQDNTQVKDAKVHLKSHEGGLGIYIKLSIDHDVVIPEMSQELQSSVKSYVEATSGATVKGVTINVDKIAGHSNPKNLRQG